MALALVLSLLVGGAAAQHLTLPIINNDEVAKALDPNDQGYQICVAAGQYVSSCVAKVGGSAALATANPTSFAACACCLGTTDVAPVYSTCSDYLGSEAPQLSSQVSAYDYLYTVCGGNSRVCLGEVTAQAPPQRTSPAARPPPPGTPEPSTTPSASPASTSSLPGPTSDEAAEESTAEGATRTGSASGTSVTLAAACTSMVDIFENCVKETPGFTNIPFGGQAYCYCCRTSGNTVTWTDEIDEYAQTCRDWAVTGDPKTAYQVAKTFATFCEHFSDACSATSTSGPDENPFLTQPPATETADQDGQVTVTVVQTPTTATRSAASNVSVSVAAGVVAMAVFAAML